AARGGFEAQHAGAGEQVQAAQAVQVLAQPVEQRLAHAVRRRTQARQFRHGDQARAPLAADDAHAAQGRTASPSPPATTTTMCSGLMRRAKASRTASAVTAATCPG